MTKVLPSFRINAAKIERVQKELARRKEILIHLSHESTLTMDRLDRQCIQSYFEKGESPQKPGTTHSLLKELLLSSYSYAPLRKYLVSAIGELPSPENIGTCLHWVFHEPDFSLEQNWTPNGITTIAERIQRREKYDLSSNRFKERMVAVLLTAPSRLAQAVEEGLDSFYEGVNRTCESGADAMWCYAVEFAEPISKVGVALICDFLKNIGFTRFVKVDHHFSREFPELISETSCDKLKAKEHFLLSQQIADLVGMTPFHLDHLLYQWGRYKRYQHLTTSL